MTRENYNISTITHENLPVRLWWPYIFPVTAHKQCPVINASIIPHESLRDVSLLKSGGRSVAE